MQLNNKSAVSIAVTVIMTVTVIAGIYNISTKQAAPDSTNKVAGESQPDKALPAGHPELTQGDAAQQTNHEEPRYGKLIEDPDARVSEFQFGGRNVRSIFIDGKVVWVGTTGGVIRYDTSTYDYQWFDKTDGLLSNGIISVSKLDGRIALGTYGGGLYLYDATNNKWENFNIADGLGDAFVYKILKSSSGDIWIATWSGLNRIRGNNLRDRFKWDLFTVENTGGGLPNNWVYSIEEGNNGEIWLATEGGVARFKDNKWENWNHSKGVGALFEQIKNNSDFVNNPAKISEHHAKQIKELGLEGAKGNVAYNPNYIVSLQVDRKNNIVWCGTWGGGLARFDGKKWHNYTVADGLPGNVINALHLDQSGKLWVGTNHGLARYDGGKFKVWTTQNGLISDVISTITTAPDGRQWIGGLGGLTHQIEPK